MIILYGRSHHKYSFLVWNALPNTNFARIVYIMIVRICGSYGKIFCNSVYSRNRSYILLIALKVHMRMQLFQKHILEINRFKTKNTNYNQFILRPLVYYSDLSRIASILFNYHCFPSYHYFTHVVYSKLFSLLLCLTFGIKSEMKLNHSALLFWNKVQTSFIISHNSWETRNNLDCLLHLKCTNFPMTHRQQTMEGEGNLDLGAITVTSCQDQHV